MDDGIDVDLARLADDGCPHPDEPQRAQVAATIANLRPWDDPPEFLTMDDRTGLLIRVRRDPATGAEQVFPVDLADALRCWATFPDVEPDGGGEGGDDRSGATHEV